ncbi:MULTISPECIES: hypothetical protein [unclassified Moorena]|nr:MULTISPECIES: hypothetical protein [unclassified Moorena]NEO12686.1 hypothetical protein [Moorena sp. SIO3E8]NEP97602.1 hypothetical protein [Moorena sp. SIO3F7]
MAIGQGGRAVLSLPQRYKLELFSGQYCKRRGEVRPRNLIRHRKAHQARF